MSWYVLDDPDSPQLDELAQRFHLHPLHVEDCRSHGERIKAEQMPDYLFVILRSVERLKDTKVDFQKVSIFCRTGFLHYDRGFELSRNQKCPGTRAAQGAGSTPEQDSVYRVRYSDRFLRFGAGLVCGRD